MKWYEMQWDICLLKSEWWLYPPSTYFLITQVKNSLCVLQNSIQVNENSVVQYSVFPSTWKCIWKVISFVLC